MPVKNVLPVLVVVWLLGTAPAAEAYIGPGAGISVVGTAVAFVGAVVFALIGFVWYPLKRLSGAFRNSRTRPDEDQKASAS